MEHSVSHAWHKRHERKVTISQITISGDEKAADGYFIYFFESEKQENNAARRIIKNVNNIRSKEGRKASFFV